MLTGRYQLLPRTIGVIVMVEEATSGGFTWRKATKDDLHELEPTIADGWRFPEERSGTLLPDGKRAPR